MQRHWLPGVDQLLENTEVRAYLEQQDVDCLGADAQSVANSEARYAVRTNALYYPVEISLNNLTLILQGIDKSARCI